MKKLLIGLGLLLSATFAKAQGLEGIVVEKYYVSNAADQAAAVGNSANALPVGSVTYRIYVDMATGYKFQAAFGNAAHSLIMTTTTQFYNNTDRGDMTPNGISFTNTKNNTVILDSWLSVGANATGRSAVVKTEDGDGTVIPTPNGGVIQNNDATAGFPLNARDGMIVGTPDAVTFVGISATDVNFTGTGNNFTVTNGAWSSLTGAVGPTAANRILIAQITTDGVFHYELNVQLGTPSNGVEKYVASNAGVGETNFAALSGTLNQPNSLPTVSITTPSTGSTYFTGAVVAIAATASDVDGTVDSVQFFVDNVKIGSDLSGPAYNINWTSTTGTHIITAKATDNNGAVVTSSSVSVIVGNNSTPLCSITSPANGANFTAPAPVTITANATDADGPIDSVVFYVNGVRVGVDNTPSPFSFVWTSVIGTANLTARAYDQQNASTLSSVVSIEIADPNGSPYKVGTIKSTCISNSFCLPVIAFNAVSNVIGYDVVMNYDVNKVTPTGVITVSNNLITPSYVDVVSSINGSGVLNISAYLNGSAPSNANFSGTGNLFCIEFVKTASFTSTDTAIFTVSSLKESYFTEVKNKLTDPGKFITYKDSAFNASLKFWQDNSPIAYNASNTSQFLVTNIYGNNTSCNNKSAVAVQPDLSGNFSYSINNGLAVNIERDINGATDVQPVINGFDAFLTRKVLLNDPSFTPNVYQIIAMDVNKDGAVSAGDVSQINQRAVLINPEFKQAWNYTNGGTSNGQPSKDWTFIDATTLNTNLAYRISSTYPNDNGVGFSKSRVPVVPFCLAAPVQNAGTCPFISTENYKGILVGDVNGNFATVGSGGTLRISGSDKIVLDLSHAVISNGYIDIPVSVTAADMINALDFSLQFNEGVLTFNSVVDHTNYLQELANYNASDRTLRFTSNSMQNYDINKTLVSLRFAMNASAVNTSDFSSLKGFLNGEAANVEVTGNTVTAVKDMKNENNFVIYPNPANTSVNVVVNEKATVEMIDMEGRTVVAPILVNANQKQVISTDHLANGIYMMKIISENFVSMKQVVISK